LNQNKNTNILLTEKLEIVLTRKILAPPEIGRPRLKLFSLMVNPRLLQTLARDVVFASRLFITLFLKVFLIIMQIV